MSKYRDDTLRKFMDLTSRDNYSPLNPKPQIDQKTPASIITKKMYEMEINDYTFDINGSRILRVPGGWIYTAYNVFVPYNNEGFIENLKL